MDDLHAIVAKALAEPTEASPFEAIRARLEHDVFGHPAGFIVQLYCVSVISSIICISIACGFAVRLTHSAVQPVFKDGCLSRLDPRFWIPVLWGLYAALTAGMSARLIWSYQVNRFTGHAAFMQLFDPCLLAISGHLVFVNIAANVPYVRTRLVSCPHTRWNLRSYIIPLVTALPALAVIGGLTPAALQFSESLRMISEKFKMYMARIDISEAQGSLKYLQESSFLVTQLMGGTHQASDALAYAGRFHTAFILFWLVAGGFLYFLLDRSIRKSIRLMEAAQVVNDLDENDSPLNTPLYVLPVLNNRKASDTSEFFGIVKVGSDQPFGNLDKPSMIPKRYQAVIDESGDVTSNKIEQLRTLLRRDRWNHICMIAIAFGFLSESLLEAVRGHERFPGVTILPVIFAWQSWVFLIPAVPLATLFVLDSIRIAKFENTPASQQFTLPLAGVNIGPELPFPTRLKLNRDNSVDKFDLPPPPSVRGIQVSRVAMVTIDDTDPRHVYSPRRKSFPTLK